MKKNWQSCMQRVKTVSISLLDVLCGGNLATPMKMLLRRCELVNLVLVNLVKTQPYRRQCPEDVKGKGTVSKAGAVVPDPFVKKDLYCWFG